MTEIKKTTTTILEGEFAYGEFCDPDTVGGETLEDALNHLKPGDRVRVTVIVEAVS